MRCHTVILVNRAGARRQKGAVDSSRHTQPSWPRSDFGGKAPAFVAEFLAGIIDQTHGLFVEKLFE
jgi:hypothetical protein